MSDLTAAQIDRFIQEGFVQIESAISREPADAARSILWKDTGCDPEDVTTWNRDDGDYSPMQLAIRQALAGTRERGSCDTAT